MDANKLRDSRIKLRLSQSAMATIAGITNTHLSRIENETTVGSRKIVPPIGLSILMFLLLRHPEDVNPALEMAISLKVKQIRKDDSRIGKRQRYREKDIPKD